MCIPEQPESIQNNQHTTIQVSCFKVETRQNICAFVRWHDVVELIGVIELCRRVDVDIMCGLVIYASGGGWEIFCNDI